MERTQILRLVASLCILFYPGATIADTVQCAPTCAATEGSCYEPLGRCDCPQAKEENPASCEGPVIGAQNLQQRFPTGTEKERQTTMKRYKCSSECNKRGRCLMGFCSCREGYFGTDCALSHHKGKTLVLDGEVPDTAMGGSVTPKIFIYELPSIYTVVPLSDRPLELGLVERITHSGHRVGDPEEADYFFIPANLRFLTPARTVAMLDYVMRTWPYFKRKRGADHMLVHPGDWGPCQMMTPTSAACAGLQCQRPPQYKDIMFLQHWGMTESSRPYGNRGPCFVPGKDILLPPIQGVRQSAAQAASPYWALSCSGRRANGDVECPEAPPPNRSVTFFFAGSVDKPWLDAQHYSGGVRKKVFDMFKDQPGFEVYDHAVGEYERKLASSVFCLAPAGAGWGRRAVHAALFGCIPVVVQDNVLQAFDELFDWEQFSVRVAEADIPKLPLILQSISPHQIESMQAALKCVHEHFMWSSIYGTTFGEDGTVDAFATLMHILDQRLKSDHAVARLRDVCTPDSIPPAARLPRGKRLCHFPCPDKFGHERQMDQHPWPAGGAMSHLVEDDHDGRAHDGGRVREHKRHKVSRSRGS